MCLPADHHQPLWCFYTSDQEAILPQNTLFPYVRILSDSTNVVKRSYLVLSIGKWLQYICKFTL